MFTRVLGMAEHRWPLNSSASWGQGRSLAGPAPCGFWVLLRAADLALLPPRTPVGGEFH